MKFRPTALIAALSSLCITIGLAYAQSSDSIVQCGESSPCSVDDFVSIVKGAVVLLLAICLPLLVIYIIYRFVVAWYQVANGNSSAYRDAMKKAGNAVVGFFMAVLVFGGGLLVMLNIFGASEFTLKFLKLFSEAFVPHVYAAGSTLPLPTTFTNLFDFILAALRVVMRFFIYPAVILMWAWTGFSFVYAQGKPEALAKAKKLLFWAVVSTFIMFVTQGAVMAIKGTAKEILPGAFPQETKTVKNATNPLPGQGCEGGVVSIDDTCVPSTKQNTATVCSGKANGTLCSVEKAGAVGGYVGGVCSFNGDGVFDCYVAEQNAFCLTLDATGAQVDGYMVKNSVGTLDCAPTR